MSVDMRTKDAEFCNNWMRYLDCVDDLERFIEDYCNERFEISRFKIPDDAELTRGISARDSAPFDLSIAVESGFRFLTTMALF